MTTNAPEMFRPGMPGEKKNIFSRRAKLLFICFAYMSMAAMTLTQ